MCRIARPLSLSVAGLLAIAMASGCGSSSSTSPHTATTARTSTTRTSTAPTTVTGTTTAPGVVTGSAQNVTATLHAGTHNPKVNVSWPIHFTVTRLGAPAKASVSYEYLFAGQVVARRSHYVFVWHFSDAFHWPPSAVGYPLTFRAVIVSGTATIYLEYPVQVVK